MKVQIYITATADDGADAEAVAQAVFDHLCETDDEATPGVESFDNFDYEVEA